MKMKTNNIRRFATILFLSLMAISADGETIEQMPSFPGGDKALFEFLKENVRCPKKVIRKGISGRVIVSFFVEKDGSITELKIVKNSLKDKSGNPCTNSSINKRCEKEALRVFRQMPKWIPGRQGYRIVRMKCSILVWFNRPKPKSD